MAKVLTELNVQNAKPKRATEGKHKGEKVCTEIPDAGCRGLYLVVHPTGHRAWCVRYRFGGRTRKLTLGEAIAVNSDDPVSENTLTLALARKQAADALHKVKLGVDPASEKQAKQKRPGADTFAKEAEGCFARAKSLRSANRQLHELKRLAFPALGDKPITSIRRSDVVKLLDAIENDNGPVMADLVLAAINKVMNDHARRSDDFRSPLVRGMQRANAKERARERVLSDDELRAIWTKTSDGTFGAYVRFLSLTGCRRNEAALMPWSELSNGLWTLPASRNKAKKELVRPLSRAVQELLAGLPRTSDLIFHGIASGGLFTKGKNALDKASAVSNWRLHDLRRTARSLMSRAGVPDNHAERCLGHVIPGVKGVYDRHKYEAEMLAAYERLATQIKLIVNPRDNVVPMVQR